MKRTRKDQGGFTMVEALLVLAIIAVMSAVFLAMNYGGSMDSTNVNACQDSVMNIASACNKWKMANGEVNFNLLVEPASAAGVLPATGWRRLVVDRYLSEGVFVSQGGVGSNPWGGDYRLTATESSPGSGSRDILQVEVTNFPVRLFETMQKNFRLKASGVEKVAGTEAPDPVDPTGGQETYLCTLRISF